MKKDENNPSEMINEKNDNLNDLFNKNEDNILNNLSEKKENMINNINEKKEKKVVLPPPQKKKINPPPMNKNIFTIFLEIKKNENENENLSNFYYNDEEKGFVKNKLEKEIFEQGMELFSTKMDIFNLFKESVKIEPILKMNETINSYNNLKY